ncbi:MAG: PEGA domain-containing protein [Deinococcales bacterium]
MMWLDELANFFFFAGIVVSLLALCWLFISLRVKSYRKAFPEAWDQGISLLLLGGIALSASLIYSLLKPNLPIQPSVPAEEPKQVSFFVNTEPARASVYINGKFAGQSPINLILNKDEPYEYVLVADPSLYAPFADSIRLSRDDNFSLHFAPLREVYSSRLATQNIAALVPDPDFSISEESLERNSLKAVLNYEGEATYPYVLVSYHIFDSKDNLLEFSHMLLKGVQAGRYELESLLKERGSSSFKLIAILPIQFNQTPETEEEDASAQNQP